MKITLCIPTKEVSDAMEAALASVGLVIVPVDRQCDTVYIVKNIPAYIREAMETAQARCNAINERSRLGAGIK